MKKPTILSEMPLSRRTVLASATLVPLAALMSPVTAAAQVPVTPVVTAVLSADQRAILEALIDRLVPQDENGPGAVECGAGEYIERCLADYLVGEKPMFLDGLAGLDLFALRTEGIAFASLTAEKRDEVLTAIDNNRAPNLRGFFNRAKRLTLEGMFSDPVYGGNKNFAGWDLIRYPGAKFAVGPEEQMKTAPTPYRHEVLAAGADHDSRMGDNHGH